MLRLSSCIAARILSSTSAATTICPLHRVLSAAAAAPAVSSTNPSFAVEEYLVETCGLARAQAVKASTKLSHLKSPSKPDAVLAFLAGLGLSSADVAAAVAKDPLLLRAKVERTLAPVAVGLTGLGLSRSEIAHVVSLAPNRFRCRSIISNLSYYLWLFGSNQKLLPLLKHNNLIGSSIEKVIKPNVAFLRECGLSACDIAKLCRRQPRLLSANPERVQAMVVCVEGLGVQRGSGMFTQMLLAVASLSEAKIAVQVEHLKKTVHWLDAEVGIAVCKYPALLKKSKDMLQCRSEFLISEVGLEPSYIAHRPSMLAYSLEGRLRPRYYVVKFLKANGLLDHDRDYYSIVAYTEKVFVEKIICPHKEAAPHLAEDYAAACKGQLPTRFRFA